MADRPLPWRKRLLACWMILTARPREIDITFVGYKDADD